MALDRLRVQCFALDRQLSMQGSIVAAAWPCTFQVLLFSCPRAPLQRPYLDSKTASTIAAFIVYSKLQYCNSLYYNLPISRINRLQQIQNCIARTVVKAPKSFHITPIFRSQTGCFPGFDSWGCPAQGGVRLRTG